MMGTVWITRSSVETGAAPGVVPGAAAATGAAGSISGVPATSFLATSCSGNCTRNLAAASRMAALVALTMGEVVLTPPDLKLPYPVKVSESAVSPVGASTLRRYLIVTA